VDEALRAHPLVTDAGTVGVDHERFGTVPAALVVPAEDLTPASLTERLDAAMQDELAAWQRPRLYGVVEEIPRTATKQTVIRAELRTALPDVTLERDATVTHVGALAADDRS
jgi:acyl-coenzyme A synthetase/AMP-(fatty) acid ligase